MSGADPAGAQARGRRLLLGVAAAFFVPLLLATLWYANVDRLRPAGGANHGELITPARPLSGFELRTPTGETLDREQLARKWTLVHIAPARCAEACARALYHTRQVRIALGRDTQRVQRLLLITAAGTDLDLAELHAAHPDLIVADGDRLAAAIEHEVARLAPRSDAVFLFDPLVNLMLRFGPEVDPRNMIKDLKRLLKASRIG